MTKDKLPREYLQWIEDENKIASVLYSKYADEKASEKGRASAPTLDRKPKIFHQIKPLVRVAAVAVLVLTLGVSLWIKRDDIFKPNYTEEQIALSYDQTLRALAECVNSLSKEMNQLKNLKQISEPLDNIKKLGTVINN